MPSRAMENFKKRLEDVEQLVDAHGRVTGKQVTSDSGTVQKKRGATKKISGKNQREGAAITRAGIVFLCAAFEAFVEDLFEDSAKLLAPGKSEEDLKKRLFAYTTEKFNAPTLFNINNLYANLGLWWVLDGLSWQKFPAKAVKDWIELMVTTRGKIAHGKQPGIKLQTLRLWLDRCKVCTERLESVMADYIQTRTNVRPAGWQIAPAYRARAASKGKRKRGRPKKATLVV